MTDKEKIQKLDIATKARLLTGSSFWKSAECRQIDLRPALMSDGPHGLRVQDKLPNHLGMGTSLPSTCFPTASSMACSWDISLGEELGAALGGEAAHMGVAMVLGPGLNIKRSPKCGRNFEYFSEDSYLSGKLAAAYVRGIQSAGVYSCIKHFAVNSREYARMVYDCRVDEQTLRETYLTGFEIAVKEGKPAAVMTAYNKLNGTYCNSDEYLISGILRGEWGFDGLVVSDWGGTYDKVAAVRAGVDLEMPRCDFSAEEVQTAAERGELDPDIIDKSISRQLAFSRAAQNIKERGVDWRKNAELARRCAENSLVLLKNEGNALPLNNDERVALVGSFANNPRYQGAGSSLVNPTSLDNILGAMQSSPLNFVGFAEGFDRKGGKNAKLKERALRLAEGVDTVVLCMGLPEGMELESADRAHLQLPENQIDLLKSLSSLGKKIVVVLSCGGVVDTSWDIYCSALIHAHLAGQSGGGAVVNALAGKVNPSGRLAESYPLHEGDVPCDKIYDKYAYKMDFAEGIYVGYKYYNALGVPVKYPFGYGLSYTTFVYSDACADEKGVYVTVTNAGKVDGATVVQMYVRAPRPELEVPPAELKGFKKVFLPAGASERVFIPFDEYTFRVWDNAAHCWRQGGRYTVYLGENSRDFYFEHTISFGWPPAICGAPKSYEQYFNSHISADESRPEYKKGHLIATPLTEIADLRYCKGVVARLFAFIARLYSHSKDELLSNSMNHLPIRFIMVFLHFNAARARGFIEACNGHFFKGVKKILFGK